MSDVRLKFTGYAYDIDFQGDDLESDDGFETAVIISLFSDRRVTQTELYEGIDTKRGWFGDLTSPFEGDLIGSKLWLLDRGKMDANARNLVEEYAREALQWFVDDGVAESLDVTATIVNREYIMLTVSINKPKNTQPLTYRFQLLWDAQGLKVQGI